MFVGYLMMVEPDGTCNSIEQATEFALIYQTIHMCCRITIFHPSIRPSFLILNAASTRSDSEPKVVQTRCVNFDAFLTCPYSSLQQLILSSSLDPSVFLLALLKALRNSIQSQ